MQGQSGEKDCNLCFDFQCWLSSTFNLNAAVSAESMTWSFNTLLALSLPAKSIRLILLVFVIWASVSSKISVWRKRIWRSVQEKFIVISWCTFVETWLYISPLSVTLRWWRQNETDCSCHSFQLPQLPCFGCQPQAMTREKHREIMTGPSPWMLSNKHACGVCKIHKLVLHFTTVGVPKNWPKVLD